MSFLNSIEKKSKKFESPFTHWELNEPLTEEQITEIINADIMQMYEGFNILKAMPSTEEKFEIKHYLFGVIKKEIKFTVADWIKLAKDKISEIHEKGKVPIVVGGSGMYLNAAINGLSEIPDIKKVYRHKAEHSYKIKGFDFILKKQSASNPPISISNPFNFANFFQPSLIFFPIFEINCQDFILSISSIVANAATLPILSVQNVLLINVF